MRWVLLLAAMGCAPSRLPASEVCAYQRPGSIALGEPVTFEELHVHIDAFEGKDVRVRGFLRKPMLCDTACFEPEDPFEAREQREAAEGCKAPTLGVAATLGLWDAMIEPASLPNGIAEACVNHDVTITATVDHGVLTQITSIRAE